MSNSNFTGKNTDRVIWCERPGDYYADSIHVTQNKDIGINCGGFVVVAPLRDWFAARRKLTNPSLPKWRRKLVKWLLDYPEPAINKL